jgi:cell fate regulator YaaT (PSP1 superfamily)
MAGCTSCGVGGCGTKKGVNGEKTLGCRSNGGCSTGGCNKMNVFDWLSNMELPGDKTGFNLVEVRFKGGRKEFFRNEQYLDLTTGDPVIVDVPNGHHLGFVSLQGELVRLQMVKKGVKEDSEEIRSIYRIANAKDIEKWEETSNREMPTLFRTRQIVDELRLQMKLSDVEYQVDNTKATFFYSADERVDFRELIKRLAGEFKIRVEMRQISLRQEAGRLGGIGSCGRELCCSTWLTDFKSVSTSAARYQNLSLNPSKLSGQCGRLKCCLNYELETYMDALKDIPNVDKPLHTIKGEAYLQKTDIFKKIMWFGFKEDTTWYPLSIERVNEILALNQKGVKVYSLSENEEAAAGSDGPTALNDDLERMDKRFNEKDKRRKKKKKKKTAGSGVAGANDAQSVKK